MRQWSGLIPAARELEMCSRAWKGEEDAVVAVVILEAADLRQPERVAVERDYLGEAFRMTCDSKLHPRRETLRRADPSYASCVEVAAEQSVLLELDPPAARITRNRPDKRNALSLEVMGEVTEALRSAAAENDVRVIVIAGAGPAFSAGHDLGEMVGRDLAFYQRLFDACTVMMELIHKVPQPVIAKVHGAAYAAGCQLVAACDLAVAAEGTRFATPGVKIGLFCSTPMVPVSWAVGRKRALELLLTGEPIDAATAADWGLINGVVPADELDAEVGRLVEAIAKSSPLTVGIGKEAFYAQIELDESGAYELTKTVMSENSVAADAQEGIGAFLEKREPRWSGS